MENHAFATKCASYLQQGIGLIVVDLVTDRSGDLHADILRRLNEAAAAPAADLWAASYRPWQDGENTNLEIWHHPLAIGAALPTLPFWLQNGRCIKLDFDATYSQTLKDQRMLPAGTGIGATKDLTA